MGYVSAYLTVCFHMLLPVPPGGETRNCVLPSTDINMFTHCIPVSYTLHYLFLLRSLCTCQVNIPVIEVNMSAGRQGSFK